MDGERGPRQITNTVIDDAAGDTTNKEKKAEVKYSNAEIADNCYKNLGNDSYLCLLCPQSKTEEQRTKKALQGKGVTNLVKHIQMAHDSTYRDFITELLNTVVEGSGEEKKKKILQQGKFKNAMIARFFAIEDFISTVVTTCNDPDMPDYFNKYERKHLKDVEEALGIFDGATTLIQARDCNLSDARGYFDGILHAAVFSGADIQEKLHHLEKHDGIVHDKDFEDGVLHFLNNDTLENMAETSKESLKVTIYCL